MPLVETPVFPSGIAGAGDLLNWKNKVPSQASPTLASGIDASETTITVATGTGSRLPSDNFSISIDNEIILIASRSGDTLTVATRGYEGTTGVAHNAGATVEARITAKSHNQVAAEVAAIETALGVNLLNVLQTKVATKNANFNFADTDAVILGTSGAGGITGTLPTAVGRAGRSYTVVKVDSGAGALAIATTSAQTVSGESGWSLVNQWQFVIVVSDGANWVVIGGN